MLRPLILFLMLLGTAEAAPAACATEAEIERFVEDFTRKRPTAALSADGTVLSAAPGHAVLGHPAASALWLIGKGLRFGAGDMISVESFGPLVPAAKAGAGVTVRYDGLPGNTQVHATFDE